MYESNSKKDCFPVNLKSEYSYLQYDWCPTLPMTAVSVKELSIKYVIAGLHRQYLKRHKPKRHKLERHEPKRYMSDMNPNDIILTATYFREGHT